MKKIQYILCFVFLGSTVLSCEKVKTPLVIHHADKEQPITCGGDKSALLNEVLHQFEEDISNTYDPVDKLPYKAYSTYLYAGLSGTANYDRIVSKHAIDLRKILVLEGVIEEGIGLSNLNYKHPFVQCIFDNMKDKNLVKTIRNLEEIGAMTPSLFNTRMKNYARTTKTDRYAALYIALDTYYQRLTMTEVPEQELDIPVSDD